MVTSVEREAARITAPGIYQMPDREYHADPVAAAPSLSRSIAKLLIEASPAHAFAAHPRLGGSVSQTAASGDDDMDVGSAAHAAFLEGDTDKIVHVQFDSYRTNAAKEFRDQTLRSGKIPLKTKQYDAAMHVAEALENFRIGTSLFMKDRKSVV